MRFREMMVIVVFSALTTAFVVINLMLLASEADAKTVDFTGPNLVLATGEVDGTYLGKAQYLESMAGNEKIQILINSPGGSVVMGNMFIQAMEIAKSRGSKIECAVSNIAASMAIHILAHCDVRYILRGGYILYHEARVGVMGNLTSRELRQMAASMESLTSDLEAYLQKELGVDPEFYRKNSEGETMWSATEFVDKHDDFDGILVDDIRVDKKFRKNVFSPVAPATVDTPSEFLDLDLGSPIDFPGRYVMKG